MQEETVTCRFTLERDTTLGEATAATMKAVEAVLGGTFEKTSDGGFSGISIVSVAPPVYRYRIQVNGLVKRHDDGAFSTMITLRQGKNPLRALLVIGNVASFIFFLPLGAFIGSRFGLFGALAGGGLALLLCMFSVGVDGKQAQKSLSIARKNVEAKLATIEFLEPRPLKSG